MDDDIVVDIYLNIGSGSFFPFLSIPHSDIQRLSICPFKWIRYTMFSICGAYGDLSETPGGPPIDYDGTSLAKASYCYNISDHCIFVDYDGLDDRFIATRHAVRSNNFRDAVIQRDGCCLITSTPARDCDAAHLIPRSKDDQYIMKVVQERSCLYNPALPQISGIDDVQNGVLLRKDLHRLLGRGAVAFLKTPNYGLQPVDIRVYQNHVDTGSYITLRQLERYYDDNPIQLEQWRAMGSVCPRFAFGNGANVDVLFQGTGISPPSNIILDYIYGVAAYRCWRTQSTDEGQVVMRNYHREHYTKLSPSSPSSENDPNDSDYLSETPSGDEMAEAMDEMNAFLIQIHGITPQEATQRTEKQMKELELKAQEVSRSKVVEWRNNVLL